MNLDAFLTLGVIALIFIALVKNLASPDFLFLGATTFLALLNIITPSEAFAGFSNSAMLTVGVLFVVAAGLKETGALDYVSHFVLGGARTEIAVLVRLAIVVVPLSAFLNNTPIVALFIPVVMDWCQQHRVSPSKLLIPLSFMAMLGGTCTLIGTSTNLVVDGLAMDNNLPGMHLLEISKIGIPYALLGCAYLLIFGPRFLPDRKELLEELGESRREFLIEMLVQPGCRLAGKTVNAAGLRHLQGLFLIEIDRDGTIIGPVRSDDRILENDRLIFTGVVSYIVNLEKIPGLIPATDPAYEISSTQQHDRRLCEVVISPRCPFIGKTIREANFRSTYGAAVIAVHRGGHRIKARIGDVQLRPGDTLLLQVRANFVKAFRNDPSFYLVSNVEEWRSVRKDRVSIAIFLFFALIVLTVTGLVPTLIAASLVAFLMVATGCLSAGEARRSIERQVLITIGAAFGVATALQTSGAATMIAAKIFQATHGLGPIAALTIIYLLGTLMTSVITNNAAALMLFPFCLEVARLFDVSPHPFLVTLMLSTSASFMTPIGYQTNLMIYGPGGYRFADFLRIGGPLNLCLWILAVILVPIFWPF